MQRVGTGGLRFGHGAECRGAVGWRGVWRRHMKLEQGQIWKCGEEFLRIVTWARLSIEYKQMSDPLTKEGTLHQVSKKEFCRLLKGAELVTLPKEEEMTEPEELETL